MNKVLLNNVKHGALKFLAKLDIEALAGEYLVAISVNEFVAVAAEHPIVFVKDTETGEFHSLALLGLEPGENLSCSAGKWLGRYTPQAIRYAPFSLAQTQKENNDLYVAVDEDSPLFDLSEGERLFDEDGSESAVLQKLTEALLNRTELMRATHEFNRSLADKGLLIEKTLQINTQGQDDRNLNGLYVINEEKLNELSDADFSELRKMGALPAIYAQMSSAQQIPRLVERKAARA